MSLRIGGFMNKQKFFEKVSNIELEYPLGTPFCYTEGFQHIINEYIQTGLDDAMKQIFEYILFLQKEGIKTTQMQYIDLKSEIKSMMQYKIYNDYDYYRNCEVMFVAFLSAEDVLHCLKEIEIL